MVITKTPLRISFFGGGTDHPVWYREHGGSVISSTINKFVYIQARRIAPVFDFNYRVLWSKIERVNDVGEISHPVVRAVLENHWSERSGLEVVYNADLPARSGLGSSSSFTVSMIHSINTLNSFVPSKEHLATEAINVERNLLQEPVGSQDQVAAAFGGLNHISFFQDDTFSVSPLIISPSNRAELNSHLLMFFTGFTRSSASIEEAKLKNFDSKANTLRVMQEQVDAALNLFAAQTIDLKTIGRMLDDEWKLKKSLASSVSNSSIDEAYELAKQNGAWGGKILGAGGGGFLLFLAPPEFHKKIADELKSLSKIDFALENSGSTVLAYDGH